ncbi:MAG: hypothetical protein IJ557_02575 [Bacteroidaceae bacterium]|nr:hypothetical protein [Bacteroidaceae bacterium]
MKLIDKAAVVAGIENKIKKYTKRGEESDVKRDGYGMYWGGVLSCLNEVRSFLDTLEIKEVDLEKYLKENIEDVFFDLDGVAVKGATSYLTVEDIKDIAKHFFELGLNAKKGE